MAVNDPGVDVTVYPVIALPLANAPLKVTVACALPAAALTVVGAVGTPDSVTLVVAADAALVPIAFVAFTVNV